MAVGDRVFLHGNSRNVAAVVVEEGITRTDADGVDYTAAFLLLEDGSTRLARAGTGIGEYGTTQGDSPLPSAGGALNPIRPDAFTTPYDPDNPRVVPPAGA